MIRKIHRRIFIFALALLAIILGFVFSPVLRAALAPFVPYFFPLFAIIFVAYVAYLLYKNRRLTLYYWERIRRHRLSIYGLIFVGILCVTAIIGPAFTMDP